MRVKLEFITPNAEVEIGKYAAICYDANLSEEACKKRAAKCAREGHLATLRFAHAVFHVSGVSRVCSHQFVRSKHLDFLQRSQRYCKEIDTEQVLPKNIPYDQEVLYQQAYDYSESIYLSLLAKGVKKEDARLVLPEATHTEFNVVGNFQAWLDFIKLRYDPAAQWEIREVAKQINNLLYKEAPNIFHWIP